MPTTAERRDLLKQVWEDAKQCRACALHETRTTVVFGAGNADAELMFIGEAPGAHEDLQGLPFVGQAGKLLDTLLSEIGMDRSDVFIANTLKCRPPDNRNPLALELDACQKYLFKQLELIEPTMICTLGNFSTKLLRGDPTGISKLHGQVEERQIGPRTVRLYPLYHPAAALYTRATLEVLRADFARIPELLRLGAPAQPVPDVPSLQMSGETAAADGEIALKVEAAKGSAGDADLRPQHGESAGVDSRAVVEGERPDAADGQLGLF